MDFARQEDAVNILREVIRTGLVIGQDGSDGTKPFVTFTEPNAMMGQWSPGLAIIPARLYRRVGEFLEMIGADRR